MKITLEHLLGVAQGSGALEPAAASARVLADDRLLQALLRRLRAPEASLEPRDAPVLFLGFALPGGSHGVAVARLDREDGQLRFAHGWSLSRDQSDAIGGNRALLALGVACVVKLWVRDRPGLSRRKAVHAQVMPDVAWGLLRAEILDYGSVETARTVAALAAHLAIDDDSTLVMRLPPPPEEAMAHLARCLPGLEPKSHDHWRLWRLAGLLQALPPSLRGRASFAVNDTKPSIGQNTGCRIVLLREPGEAPADDRLGAWADHVVRLAALDDPVPLAEFHRRSDGLATPRSAEDLEAVRQSLSTPAARQADRLGPAVELARTVRPADARLNASLSKEFGLGPPTAEAGWLDLSDEWAVALWKRSVRDEVLPGRPTADRLDFSLTAYATVRAEVDGSARQAFVEAVVSLLVEVRPDGVGAGWWQRATTAFRDRLWFLVDTGPVPADLLGGVASALTEQLRGSLKRGQGKRDEDIVPFLLEQGGLDQGPRAQALGVLLRQLHARGSSLLRLLWSEHALVHGGDAYIEFVQASAGSTPLADVLAELAARSRTGGAVPAFADFAAQDGHAAFVERLAGFLHHLDPEPALFAYAAYMAADPATCRALRPGLVAFLEEEAPALADLDFDRNRGDTPREALEIALEHAMIEDDDLAQRAALATDELAATLGPERGAKLIRELNDAGLKDTGVAAWRVLHAHWKDRR